MKFSMSFFVLVCAFFSTAQAGKVIKHPVAEFQNSGINYVTQIELTDTATLVTVETRFLKGWWVSFSEEDYLRDCETGEQYFMKDLLGGEMGDHIYMGESADSSFVCVFPPLPAKVGKVDFGDNVFGISLDKKAKKSKAPTVPAEVSAWLKSKSQGLDRPEPIPFDSPEFFQTDTARLCGYIQGFDKRSGIENAIIYCRDDIKRKDYPVVVHVENDGRFWADVPLQYPRIIDLMIDKQFGVPVYLEPGQSVGVLLNWEDFLLADRNRNTRYLSQYTEFMGPLGDFNQQLIAFEPTFLRGKHLQQKIEKQTPDQFAEDRYPVWDADRERLEAYAREHQISAQAKTVLEANLQEFYGIQFFSFAMNRWLKARKDTTTEVLQVPVTNDYYRFLDRIDLSSNALLVPSKFGIFINRYEFMEPLRNSSSSPIASRTPEKSLYDYLTEEKVELTPDEADFLQRTNRRNLTRAEIDALKADSVVSRQINQKYSDQIKDWASKYLNPSSRLSLFERNLERWGDKQRVLTDSLGMKPELPFQIAKVRSLRSYTNMKKEEAEQFWEALKQGIPQEFVVAAGDELMTELYPDEQPEAYEIPAGEGGDLFRKIIEPYKGKVLFVDFWGITCGPCVSGIKRMKETRAQYRNHPDIDFVFITGESESPTEDDYQQFVDEQELVHTHRLSKGDYYLMRELFHFNGIPHYIVIDKDGRVLNDDFNMRVFDRELPKIVPGISSL